MHAQTQAYMDRQTNACTHGLTTRKHNACDTLTMIEAWKVTCHERVNAQIGNKWRAKVKEAVS